MRFGIDEKVAKIKAEMDDFFVAHAIEDTFNLRVNSDEVTQKVRAAIEWMSTETQRIIDDAPEECRDEVESMLSDFEGFPYDMFRSHFVDLLKADVYQTLKVLTLIAEQLDPDGGYEKIVNMSMEDAVKTLTRDEKIDDLLDKMKNSAMSLLLETMVEQARKKRIRMIRRMLMSGGLIHSDDGSSEASDPNDDSDDSTNEEDEEEDSEFGGDVDLSGFGGFLF